VGKTKTEAANSLRSILKERVKLGGSEWLKSSGVASARTCKSILSSAMAIAVRHGALTSNPVREIEIVSKSRSARSLDEEEREQWFELLGRTSELFKRTLSTSPSSCWAQGNGSVSVSQCGGRTSPERPARSIAHSPDPASQR
jgi:hypothetical protein